MVDHRSLKSCKWNDPGLWVLKSFCAAAAEVEVDRRFKCEYMIFCNAGRGSVIRFIRSIVWSFVGCWVLGARLLQISGCEGRRRKITSACKGESDRGDWITPAWRAPELSLHPTVQKKKYTTRLGTYRTYTLAVPVDHYRLLPLLTFTPSIDTSRILCINRIR